MKMLITEAIEYTDDGFPGRVKCRFFDHYGKEWVIIEKVAVVSKIEINKDTIFPLPVFLAGEEIAHIHGSDGNDFIRFDLSKPWAIEAEDGTSIFDVDVRQILELKGENDL